MQLTTEFITKDFVDALRSGEYEQTTGKLKDGDCFCATGVACDLLAKRNPNRYTWDNDDYFIVHHTLDELPEAYTVEYNRRLEESYAYAADLLTEAWEGDSPGDLDKLTGSQFWTRIIQMNDNGEPFEVIAAWIENPLVKGAYGLG